nr:MAG TPA: hypothetical protein [Caudoviricetes sp.]
MYFYLFFIILTHLFDTLVFKNVFILSSILLTLFVFAILYNNKINLSFLQYFSHISFNISFSICNSSLTFL